MTQKTASGRSDRSGTESPEKALGRAAVPVPAQTSTEAGAAPAQPVPGPPPARPAARADASSDDPSLAMPVSSTPPVPKGRAPAASDRERAGRGPSILKLIAIAMVIVAVFAGSAVGYARYQPVVYGAQAEFLLTARPDMSDAAVDRAMLTHAMILEGDSVLRPVASSAGVRLSWLRGAVSADIVDRSNVLRVTVASSDQERATDLARRISSEYLARANSIGSASSSALPDQSAQTQATALTPATPLDAPLQPRPMRALVGGILIGLIIAAAVTAVLARPRFLTRQSPHWD